jgi:hypothetical protein
MPVSNNSAEGSGGAGWGTAPTGYTAYDSEQLTLAGLTTLTAAKVSPAGTSETLVLLGVDTAPIRWKVGGNASATVGEQMAAGDSLELQLPRAALLALTLYPVSGTPVVNVQYFYR